MPRRCQGAQLWSTAGGALWWSSLKHLDTRARRTDKRARRTGAACLQEVPVGGSVESWQRGGVSPILPPLKFPPQVTRVLMGIVVTREPRARHGSRGHSRFPRGLGGSGDRRVSSRAATLRIAKREDTFHNKKTMAPNTRRCSSSVRNYEDKGQAWGRTSLDEDLHGA